MRPLHRVMRAVVLLLAATCRAQESATQQWQALLGKSQIEEARALCTNWASSNEISLRVEAYKCLANLSLRGKQVLTLEGNEAGGGVLRGAFTPEAVDEALGYLKKGF